VHTTRNKVHGQDLYNKTAFNPVCFKSVDKDIIPKSQTVLFSYFCEFLTEQYLIYLFVLDYFYCCYCSQKPTGNPPPKSEGGFEPVLVLELGHPVPEQAQVQKLTHTHPHTKHTHTQTKSKGIHLGNSLGVQQRQGEFLTSTVCRKTPKFVKVAQKNYS